jgi:hypothetical protein
MRDPAHLFTVALSANLRQLRLTARPDQRTNSFVSPRRKLNEELRVKGLEMKRQELAFGCLLLAAVALGGLLAKPELATPLTTFMTLIGGLAVKWFGS